MSQFWLAIALTYIHQFSQFLAHVISRHSKIGYRYNFLNYLAFTYLIMLWSEMTKMKHFFSHCYSITGALCKHGFQCWLSTSLGNSGHCWTVFARNRDTAVPAEGNGNLQTLICVIVARPRWCLTLSNPVPWQNWMVAYLGYTLRMRTLFHGWPTMVNDTHTRRRSATALPVIWRSR